MPEPQIARRCPSCGVSIRVPASFCPECGKALTPKPKAARKAEDAGALTPGPGTPDITADTSRSAASKPLNSEKTGFPMAAASTPLSATRKPPVQATVGMVHSAGRPPREVIEEDGLNRVEKFRQISHVIDEAAYDPSLRFVLVAALLFVLFLVLLLLSELIT